MTSKDVFQNDWDPLSADAGLSIEIVGATLKREIKNIIKSYTGWFDPLSELIQNALDAVDKRNEEARALFTAKSNILPNNALLALLLNESHKTFR